MPLRYLAFNVWRYFTSGTLLATSILGIVASLTLSNSHDIAFYMGATLISVLLIALAQAIRSYFIVKGHDHLMTLEGADIRWIYIASYRKFWRVCRFYKVIASSKKIIRGKHVKLDRGENYFSCFIQQKDGHYFKYACPWSSPLFYQNGSSENYGKWGINRKNELTIHATKRMEPVYELGVSTEVTNVNDTKSTHPIGKRTWIGVKRY